LDPPITQQAIEYKLTLAVEAILAKGTFLQQFCPDWSVARFHPLKSWTKPADDVKRFGLYAHY